MPYKSEKIKLPRELDRRIKLLDKQREEIKEKYETGKYSQRGLAKEYKVSRRLISFILFPERYEIAKQQLKERRKDGRYALSKKEHSSITREHRAYKQKLYKEGIISLESEEDLDENI